ncbi:hypothetical protein [Bosea vaviloviae]|uniref:Uncharacterized protein n=1 Tax=Bosea vaviloviae TaxID=1526658 RepID=A0A0N1F563_9HYPH|nr:hypothetical protein [Bosea vaviloviae]KPH80683.1 hypothetical protein AE618_13175 [Bosea vaviloviae]
MSNDTHSAPRREDLPDGSVRIHFAAPILLFTEPKGHATLRRPTVAESWEIGDPLTYIVDERGYATPFLDRPRLVTWINRLVTDHDADVIGRDSDLALGMLMEDAVIDFFRKAKLRSRMRSGSSSEQESHHPKSSA